MKRAPWSTYPETEGKPENPDAISFALFSGVGKALLPTPRSRRFAQQRFLLFRILLVTVFVTVP